MPQISEGAGNWHADAGMSTGAVTEFNVQYQSKVWTHLLIQGFFFIFTIFYIVE